MFIIAGSIVGFLSTFFGVGGGTIIVPALYTLFPNAPPSVVIGTSLSAIFINSIVNSYNFRRLSLKPRVDWGILLAIGMAVGVTTSSFFVQDIEPRIGRLIFATVLILIALKTHFTNPAGPETECIILGDINLSRAFQILLTGVIGGMVAGVTGLGGGIVIVPLLMTFHNFSLSIVPIYSNMAMIGGCLVGMLRYTQIESVKIIPTGIMSQLQIGSVQFAAVICIFIGTIFTNRWGARMGQKVNKKIAERLFVTFLLIMSGRIFYTIYK